MCILPSNRINGSFDIHVFDLIQILNVWTCNLNESSVSVSISINLNSTIVTGMASRNQITMLKYITLYPSFLAAKVNDCLFRNSISEIGKNCCENLSEKKLNKQIQCIARNSWHSKYNEPYYKDKAKNEKRKVVSMEPICEWTKWIFLAGKIMWLEVATHFIAHNNYMHYDFAYLPWRIKIIKEKFAGV